MHDKHDVVMSNKPDAGSVATYTARTLPLRFVTEQVKGFGKKHKGRYAKHTLLQIFCKRIMDIDHGLWVGDFTVLGTDCNIYVPKSMPRCEQFQYFR